MRSTGGRSGRLGFTVRRWRTLNDAIGPDTHLGLRQHEEHYCYNEKSAYTSQTPDLLVVLVQKHRHRVQVHWSTHWNDAVSSSVNHNSGTVISEEERSSSTYSVQCRRRVDMLSCKIMPLLRVTCCFVAFLCFGAHSRKDSISDSSHRAAWNADTV